METTTIREVSETIPHKSCFICSKNCVCEESVDNLLEVQGIPNTIEDKLNILKVLCQLVRVKWESIESLVKDDFTFPFCLTCLKFIIQIIFLREQLFTIETDIRNRVSHIQSSVAKNLEDENFESAEWKYFRDDDEFEVNMENGGEYSEYKDTFRKQVMNELFCKQILQIKIEDEFRKGIESMVGLNLSMIQLHLQKNTFEIVDRRNCSTTCRNPTQSSCEDKETMTEEPKTEDEPMNLNALDANNLHDDTEFALSLVDNTDEISDDSDYGSPSKKIKMGKKEQPQIANHKLQKLKKKINIQNVTEHEEQVEKTSYTDDDSSGGSRNSSDIDSSDECSEEDEPPIRLPKITPELYNSLNTGSSLILPKFCPLDTNKRSEDFPRANKFRNCRNKPAGGIKRSGGIKKSEGMKKSGGYKKSGSIKKRGHAKNGKDQPISKDAKNSTVCLTQDSKTFRAKDGTVWSTESSGARENIPIKNSINGGLIGTAENPDLTPVELFKLMFCPTMANTIVGYTNAYAEVFRKNQIQTPTKSIRPWKPMTQDELYAYIGILIYLGLEKKRNVPVDEAWNADPKYVTPSIIATMGRDRFREISTFLRFDDRVARESPSEADSLDSTVATENIPLLETEVQDQHQSKLGYISQVFNPFVKNIQSHFQPYEKLVVDEMLVKYKGKVRFRVYMKSKPGKYGIKIWVLCDAKTGYILRLCIYEGKVGKKVETELGKKIVLGLVENYFGSGRTVTMDNFFTSKSLGNELLKRNMELLGTLNKNRMDVISEFTDARGRSVESSIFAFQHPFTMVSYVQRLNKPVLLLSTAHSTAEINPDIKNKPQMILDYNATKGGVDTADQMIGTFSCQRGTQRWPVKLFQAMCDIGALNAYIIWKIHRSNESDKDLYGLRRKFLRSLSEGLMDPMIRERALKPRACSLPLAIKTAIAIMGHTIPTVVVEDDNVRVTHGRCESCPGTARQRVKSTTRCAGCDKFICASHWTRITHCNKCLFKLDKGEGLVKPRRIQPKILFGIQSVPNMCTE